MKSYIDNDLACGLYRLAEQRMQAAQRQMPCTEAVFTVMTNAMPDAVSYRDIEHLGNEDFLEASYLLLLGRPLDLQAKEVWQESLVLPKTAFHTAVLKTILQSSEYQTQRMPLTDCPLQLVDEEQPNVLIQTQVLPERLVRIYQAMPRFMQKLAKKIAGKE